MLEYHGAATIVLGYRLPGEVFESRRRAPRCAYGNEPLKRSAGSSVSASWRRLPCICAQVLAFAGSDVHSHWRAVPHREPVIAWVPTRVQLSIPRECTCSDLRSATQLPPQRRARRTDIHAPVRHIFPHRFVRSLCLLVPLRARRSHLYEAVQLGCTFASAPLDRAMGRDHIAHGVKAEDVEAFFNLCTPSRTGVCPRDVPPSNLRRHCNLFGQGVSPDPRSFAAGPARMRAAALAGFWCSQEYPPMRYFATVFDTLLWLRARATMRDRYLSSRGPPVAAAAKFDQPLFNGPLSRRHRLKQLHVAAHVRRGDIGKSHSRYVPTITWSRALTSVAKWALRATGPAATRGAGADAADAPEHNSIVLHIHIFSESPWDAADAMNVSTPLRVLNDSGAGTGRLFYHEHVGGDPLSAFAHLVEADVSRTPRPRLARHRDAAQPLLPSLASARRSPAPLPQSPPRQMCARLCVASNASGAGASYLRLALLNRCGAAVARGAIADAQAGVLSNGHAAHATHATEGGRARLCRGEEGTQRGLCAG